MTSKRWVYPLPPSSFDTWRLFLSRSTTVMTNTKVSAEIKSNVSADMEFFLNCVLLKGNRRHFETFGFSLAIFKHPANLFWNVPSAILDVSLFSACLGFSCFLLLTCTSRYGCFDNLLFLVEKQNLAKVTNVKSMVAVAPFCFLFQKSFTFTRQQWEHRY